MRTRENGFSRMYVKNACELMSIFLVLSLCLQPAGQALRAAAASVGRAPRHRICALPDCLRSSAEFFLGSPRIIPLASDEDLFPSQISCDEGARGTRRRGLIPVSEQKAQFGPRISFRLVVTRAFQAFVRDPLGAPSSSRGGQG